MPGRDLRLTLDAELETSIEKAMRGQIAGSAVVVDVRTGRLLALYSKPTYDPNQLSGAEGVEVDRQVGEFRHEARLSISHRRDQWNRASTSPA